VDCPLLASRRDVEFKTTPRGMSAQGRRQQLTICLLCSGNGGTESSIYRPSKDDKHYRHRHDALVRCVASSLYGGDNNAKAGDTNNICELVFIYDGDLSCIRMSLCPSSAAGTSPPPPLEVDVVTSWRDASKEAIQNASRKRRRDDGDRDDDAGRISSSMIGSIKGGGARWTVSSSISSLKDSSTCLKTKCILDLWKTVPSSSGSLSSQIKSSQEGGTSVTTSTVNRSPLPSCMPSSKRDIVSVLQRTCPVEYLREHRLNVSEDLALRKFNMGKLRIIWEDYCKGVAVVTKKRQDGDIRRDETEDNTRGTKECINENDEEEVQQDRMERTFRAILSCVKADVVQRNGDDRPVKAVAAYLHESCDSELPCWGWNNVEDGEDDVVEQVFIFLGAVRDMTELENLALSRACHNLNIPLVGCRLGPVIEFTSKILSVVTYHFHRRVLGRKLVELWKRRLDRSREMNSEILSVPRTTNRTIHTIALVPMNSQSLTSDPLQRKRIMWCMVRICVCSLWRSKLASASTSSSTSSEPLNNVLTFLFDDGIRITLKQREFTSAMAEKHKAAPSERQILEELCHRRDVAISKIDNIHIDVKQTCNDIVSSTKSLSTFALDFTNHCNLPNHHSRKEIMNVAYSRRLFKRIDMDKETPSWTLFTIIRVRSNLDNQLCNNTDGPTKRIESIHKILLQALSKAGVQVRNQTLLLGQSSQDDEACTVTMLQHLDYQGYLYPLLNSSQEDEVVNSMGDIPKRKEKSKKKKKR